MPRAGAVGADLCVFWQLPGCSGAYLYPSYFHWLKTAAGLPGGLKKKKKILLNLKPRTARGNPDRSPRIWCPEREGRGMSRGKSRVQMRMVERKTKTQYEQHVSFSRRPLSSCWAGCQFACSLSTPGQIFFFFQARIHGLSRVPRHPQRFPESNTTTRRSMTRLFILHAPGRAGHWRSKGGRLGARLCAISRRLFF